MSAKFSKMPVQVWLDHRLTLKQIRVLGAILSFADKDGSSCHPKTEAIAERCGMLPRHVSTATTELAKLGWLVKTGKGGFSMPATYTLTIPELGSVEHSTNQGVKTKRNPPQIGEQTLPESGSTTLPESGRKTLPESGRRKEQTIDQTNDQTITRPVAATPKKSRALTAKTPAPADAAAPEKSAARNTLQDTCRETWGAYAVAYKDRYGIEPVRNSKINTQVVQFCKRVPLEEAPKIAAHYVASNAAFYVGRGHQFGNLLADAEKLRTEWATGNQITTATARQIDATQSNFNAVQRAVAMATGRRNA